jgi:4-amino-4-deoxy-L-arabinose transferase-like glycosyltransferase
LTGDPRAVRLAIALGGLCVVLLFFWRLGAAPLLEPDEGRYTEIPREMLASGDLVTPRMNGVLYFEKPPLYYWLNTAAIGVLGMNEVAARVWSAVFGVLGVLVTWRLGVGVGGRRAGVVAAAALGTFPLYVALGRLATPDMTLTFFLTVTLASFWFAHGEGEGRRTQLWWHVGFLAAALAVLTKGLVGVVIPGTIVFLYLLATGRLRVLTRVPWLTGIPLFLAVAVPWHVLAAARNPDFLWFYFVHEHVLRFATPIAERHQPFWYFAAVLVLGCAPWSGLFSSVLRMMRWRGGRSALAANPQVTFLLLWSGFVFVFFSASQSKLIPYILPALPPLAVLVGLLMARLREGGLGASRLETGGIVAGGVLTGLYGLLFVWGGLGRTDRLGLGGVISPGLLVQGGLLVAVAVLVVLAGLGRVWRNRVLALLVASCCVNVAIMTAMPLVGPERSSKQLAERVRDELRKGDLVFAYRSFPESLPVYLDRTIGVSDYRQSDLTFGISHLSPEERQRRFPTAEEFRRLWDSDRRVLVVASRRWPGNFAGDGITHARLLWEGRSFVLLSNDRLFGETRVESKRPQPAFVTLDS